MFVLEQTLSTQVSWEVERMSFLNSLTRTIISLFYCCKKLFIVMDIWMIRQNSMKHHYLKKKIFTVT